MTFIYSILIGIVAGYLANRITKGESKCCILNLILGVVGGVLGGWLFGLLGISWGGCLGEIGTSVVGAVLAVWLWNKLSK